MAMARMKIDYCYGCLCPSCTHFLCPYRKGRCVKCQNLGFSRETDCDWFENKRLAPKRFRIARKGKPRKDDVNAKLDAILEALRVPIPRREESGTFLVVYEDSCIFKGTRAECEDYAARVQHGLGSPLRIERAPFKL